MTFKEFDILYTELYTKICDKLDSDDVIDESDEISAYTLANTICTGMNYYNYFLISGIEKLIKTKNKKISLSSMFRSNYPVPYIYNICPGIKEKGDKYIDIYFTNALFNRKIGKAVIDSNMGINMEYLSDEYDKEKTLKFLNDSLELFKSFMDVLDTFKEQYPEASFEWNNNSKDSKEVIDDGFNTVSLDLEHPNFPVVSLSNLDDVSIAKTYSKKHGELYEYMDFFKDSIMKKIKVNINDLNSLYQIIVKEQMKLYSYYTQNEDKHVL